jgi:hypothetical protein
MDFTGRVAGLTIGEIIILVRSNKKTGDRII